jgi:hypothetical protein
MWRFMKQRSPSMVRTDSLNTLHKKKALHLTDNMSVQQVLIVSSHCVLPHNSKLNTPLYPNNIRRASSKERDKGKGKVTPLQVRLGPEGG